MTDRSIAARGRGSLCLCLLVVAGLGCGGEQVAAVARSEAPAVASAEAAAAAAEEASPDEAAPPPIVEVVKAPRPTVDRSILELQTGRTTTVAEPTGEGAPARVALVDLQPNVGRWYLLRLTWGDGSSTDYHLAAADRFEGQLRLSPDAGGGLVLGSGSSRTCPLWGDGDTLAVARRSGRAFEPLCDGDLFLRNPVAGHRTSKEWVTDFLRDRVPAGELVTSAVKESVFRDAFLQTAELERAPEALSARRRPAGAPERAAVDPSFEDSAFEPADLGLGVTTADAAGRMLVGRWYQSALADGVYVSGIEPRVVDPAVLAALRGRISALDEVEVRALTYLVAFDLSRFSLGFALGTDHPRVGWSERVPPEAVDSRLPGPDGFDTVAPLARTGRLAPDLVARVAATFVGGFKRSHGAFKFGDLSRRNRGSHYGFVEEGVILSTLEPGLATALVTLDGEVELKTWTEEDDARLGEIRYARQNGVPIIERDASAGTSTAGGLVTRWADGNWSGSQDKRFRTVRSGLCLRESATGRHLLFGYFSSVTPSAMALVFQAYGCSYAMLLDINALEHTYLAVYGEAGATLGVQHLVRGMEVLDQTFEGQVVPRFVGYPDNRDFFFLLRREE